MFNFTWLKKEEKKLNRKLHIIVDIIFLNNKKLRYSHTTSNLNMNIFGYAGNKKLFNWFFLKHSENYCFEHSTGYDLFSRKDILTIRFYKEIVEE